MLKSDFQSLLRAQPSCELFSNLPAPVQCQTPSAADDGHYYATQVGDFVSNSALTCPMVTFSMIGSRFQTNFIVRSPGAESPL